MVDVVFQNIDFLGYSVVIYFITAAVISNIFVRIMIMANISDTPVARSAHQNSTPRAGGVGIIAGFFATFMFFNHSSVDITVPNWPYILTGIILIAIIKLCDDISDIKPIIRLLAQITCSILMVIAGLKVVFEPGTWWVSQQGFATALSVLCFMFAMNATNFADGLNGLLSGSVLVAVLCAFVDLSMHNTAVASVDTISNALVILAGAIFGFFIMNFPRAKIFMGDVGSSFLGVMLGILALQLQYVYKPGYVLPTVHDGPFTLLFPLSFLWFDVIFTILRRALLRRKLSQPHQDHLFHILYRCGFTHTFITILHIVIALALGLINLLCHMTNIDNEWAAYCYYFIQLIYLIWVFSISRQKGITV